MEMGLRRLMSLRRLPNLPHEVVYDILSRLPIKSLCRFKAVSKPWLALITDPDFIKSHLHQSKLNNKLIITVYGAIATHCISESMYSLDYRTSHHNVAKLEMPSESLLPSESSFATLSSFNGVLLLDIGGDIGDELCLWNPSVRMCQKFPQIKCQDAPGVANARLVTHGLGYDSVSDDFKVIGIVFSLSEGEATCVVHVLSSKLSSWKSIGVFNYCPRNENPGTVLNGAPHWVVRKDTNLPLTTVIVGFDVIEEKFIEVPKPNYVSDKGDFVLGVLSGLLCVVNNHRQHHSDAWHHHSDVWVMKEYGVKESWTKLFVARNGVGEFFFRLKPLCDTKDGEVVMVLDSDRIVIYNPKQNSYKRIGKQNSYKRVRMPETVLETCIWIDAELYTESLFSPCGCDGTKWDPLSR